MKVDRKDIERNLPTKGFVRESRGRDHIWFHHEFQGRRTGVSTCISHTRKMKDISGDLLTCIRKQLSLDTNRDAIDLIKCPMNRDEYNSILSQKNIIPIPNKKVR